MQVLALDEEEGEMKTDAEKLAYAIATLEALAVAVDSNSIARTVINRALAELVKDDKK